MNVTGVEWRGQDPREGQYAAGGRQRRARKAAGPEKDDPPDDFVEVHGEPEEEQADGLDIDEVE